MTLYFSRPQLVIHIKLEFHLPQEVRKYLQTLGDEEMINDSAVVFPAAKSTVASSEHSARRLISQTNSVSLYLQNLTSFVQSIRRRRVRAASDHNIKSVGVGAPELLEQHFNMAADNVSTVVKSRRSRLSAATSPMFGLILRRSEKLRFHNVLLEKVHHVRCVILRLRGLALNLDLLKNILGTGGSRAR